MILIYSETEIVGEIPDSFIPLYPDQSLQSDSDGIIVTNYSMFVKWIHIPLKKSTDKIIDVTSSDVIGHNLKRFSQPENEGKEI